MNKGLTILAKYGTNERIIVFLNPHQQNIVKVVNERFGGEWVKVNELCLGDILLFESDDIYLGYDQRPDDNYCQGVLIKKSEQ